MDEIVTRYQFTRCSYAIHSFVQNLSQIGQEMAEEFNNTHTHKKNFRIYNMYRLQAFAVISAS